MHQRGKSKQGAEEECSSSDGSHSHQHGGIAPHKFLSPRRILQVFLLRLIMSTVLQHCADVPDEWWQSTEVAYHNVFGVGHLPWEWSVELRSYIYPLPFDFAFRLLRFLSLDTALLMWLVPKMIASAAATAIDIQTYRLGAKLDKDLGLIPRQKSPGAAAAAGNGDGEGLTVAKVAFMFSLAHWFTGYIGVRTQSNVLETLLLLTATLQTQFLPFLFYAGFGCALRMTCVVPLTPFALIHVFGSVRARGIRGLAQKVVELIIMLCFWLAISMSVDFMFYGKWTLTPLNFFLFNVLKGHSAIFGTHPWHWYFSTAFPVVSLPFTLILPLLLSLPLWKRVSGPARWRLGIMCFSIVFTMAVYSLVPHKELRFFYPVVPFMIIIAAFLYLHHPWLLQKQSGTGPSQPRFWLFMFFVVTNVITYLIISVGYRRGTLDVMAEVRSGAVLTNADGTPKVIEHLDILTGCYATAGYSYVHGRVKHLRTMDCTPVVINEATSETLPTERDVFGDHPVEFVRWVYDGVAPSDNPELVSLLKAVVPAGGSWATPDALIAYTYVIDGIRESFLEKHGFVRHQKFYHTFYVFQPHEDLTIEIWKRP